MSADVEAASSQVANDRAGIRLGEISKKRWPRRAGGARDFLAFRPALSPAVASGFPVLDCETRDRAVKQSAVVRHQRRASLDRRGGDVQIDVLLDDPAPS